MSLSFVGDACKFQRNDTGAIVGKRASMTAPSSPPKAPLPTGPRLDPDDEGDLAVEQVKKTQRPRRYKVIFHNDDYTTREFVVEMLMLYFDKDESEASFIMLSVHLRGSGVAGVYPRDVAESKVAKVMKHARSQGMPLMVTAEPE
ncbi:MAG: ATP-dependent Clp protease adapter ClpS [Polyangiales bacterium]